MQKADIFNPNNQMLLSLNQFIHHENKMYEYHMAHIKLVRKYALIINKRCGCKLNEQKLSYIALAHDLFKERSLDPNKTVTWKGFNIPQDTNRYVRQNLDLLEEYGLDDYFNTDIQYHALTAGLFVLKEFNITDKEILYPIWFHSCPIIPIYEELSPRIQNMVDTIMLADKLSSNYLRINLRHVDVRIDLDQAVFGTSGNEFNYTLGLFIARLIGQGKSEEEQSKIATEFYYKRLSDMNPIISKSYSIRKLGGTKQWPPRKSQALMMH